MREFFSKMICDKEWGSLPAKLCRTAFWKDTLVTNDFSLFHLLSSCPFLYKSSSVLIIVQDCVSKLSQLLSPAPRSCAVKESQQPLTVCWSQFNLSQRISSYLKHLWLLSDPLNHASHSDPATRRDLKHIIGLWPAKEDQVWKFTGHWGWFTDGHQRNPQERAVSPHCLDVIIKAKPRPVAII